MSMVEQPEERAAAGPRVISVSGQGTVQLAPDTAEITLGVGLSAADLASVQSDAAATMRAVQQALVASGVPEAKIATVNYTLTIERDHQQPGQPITGYTMTDLVRVSLSPVSRLGPTLQAAIAAGANQIQEIGFTVADRSAAEQEARRRAMTDARAKAEQLAQLAGVALGQPVSISEGDVVPLMPQGATFRSFSLKAGAMAPPIQGGESTISVSVQVQYAF